MESRFVEKAVSARNHLLHGGHWVHNAWNAHGAAREPAGS